MAGAPATPSASSSATTTTTTPGPVKKRRGRPPSSGGGRPSAGSSRGPIPNKLLKKMRRLLEIVIEYKDKYVLICHLLYRSVV